MAKGNSLMTFTSFKASYPDAGEAPYPSKLVAIGTIRQAEVINFIAAPGSNLWVYFTSKMSSYYSNHGIEVYIYWTASTAEANDVIWGAAFEYVIDGMLITADSFATAQTVTDTGNAGGSDYLQICNISFTNAQIDGIVADSAFRMKFYRDTDDAGDDHTGIAQLHTIELREGV